MVNQFIFSDPAVDVVARDGGANRFDNVDIQRLDGTADELLPQFGSVILGLRPNQIFDFFEIRSVAEFDISDLPRTLNGEIIQALFSAPVRRVGTTAPSSLSIYGYVGNGTNDNEDFQAGLLVDSSSVVGVVTDDIVTFDITSFLQSLVEDNAEFAGFTIRADEVGSISWYRDQPPQLQIQTSRDPTPITLANPVVADNANDPGVDGAGDFLDFDQGFSAVNLEISREIANAWGEDRSIVEFDLDGFTVPDGETITGGKLDVEVSDIQVAGLGQEGSDLPSSLSVYGYQGNGEADLSDFSAGTLLDTIDTSAIAAGERLSFDIPLQFIEGIISDANATSFAGFTIRADSISGIALNDSATGGPMFIIETTATDTSEDTIIVDTLVDEDDGDFSEGDRSLREALDRIASGGTITFASSLAQADAGFGNGVLGLTLGQLVIDQSITINGLGADQLTLEAQGRNRVVRVDDSNPDTSINVTLTEVKIANGSLLEGEGAGIFNNETLTIRDSKVTGNEFIRASRGSGIYNAGNLQVINSAIYGNLPGDSFRVYGGLIGSVANGIGLFNKGIAEIIDSEVTGHSADLGSGAGIANDVAGRLILRNSELSNNRIARLNGSGGSLSNQGTATLIDSTVTDSLASEGGGIANTGSLQLVRSAVSGNTAQIGFNYGYAYANSGIGGGILNDQGTLTVENSTISDNTAALRGGGIFNGGRFNGGTITLANSTIAFNTQAGSSDVDAQENHSGGGIYTTATASTTSVNSIIAGNTDIRSTTTERYAPDVFGDLDGSSAFNLIGDGAETNLQNGVNNNQVGTTANPIDPGLGNLQDNGGPTLTRALLDNSPAVNAGSNGLIPDGTTTDQRGEARIVGDTVDIGAYESDVTDPGEPDTEPTVENPILDQLAQVAQSYQFELPDDVFDDADGDVLTTSASLENGQPLPNWLSFNAATETLQGMPQNSDVGTVAIAITATDDDGNQVTDIFDLTVEGPSPTLNEINGDDRNNRLDGTREADLMRGFGGKDRLRGFGGDDQLFGDANNDILDGNAGNDQAFGGTGKDRISGGLGDDELFGEEGSDRLSGNDGNDELSGGDGNDSLNGDKGDDILMGGSGRNQLRGGQGRDGFVLEQGDGFSQVKDFQLGEDTILLPNGLTFGDLTITQASRRSKIRVGDDLALEIFGVSASDLDAGSFESL